MKPIQFFTQLKRSGWMNKLLAWIGAIALSFSGTIALPAHSFALPLTYDQATIAATQVDPGDLVERAESQLDEAAGAGTSDRIKGRFREGMGAVKQEGGEATNDLQQQAEGMTDQMKGRAQRDIGRTKQAAEEAGEEAEDTAKGFVESVKDFFN
jgi:uncharacterized protein YjbJ (UPF0337 family)